MEVGTAIRKLRQEKGISLRELAKRIEISPATLSHIENNKSSPNLIVLHKIADALGETVIGVLSVDQKNNITVTRKEERKRHIREVLPQGKVMEEFLVKSAMCAMQPALIILPPGAVSKERVFHQGEEYIFVLEGELKLTLYGQGTFILEEEDSIYFASEIPHSFANNLNNGKTKFLITATPPNF